MRGEDRLLELQEIDSAIDHLTARRSELEFGSEVAAAREAAEQAETLLGELRLAIDSEVREQKRLEHDIETLELKAVAEEKRMYDGSIVNQKELEALQHEISNIKDRRSRFEDELLEKLERLEELEARANTAEHELAGAREHLDAVGGESRAELDRTVAGLVERRSARDALAAGIDEELLELYEELRGTKKGVGAAALVDGVCQGCHQTLSAVQHDKLKHTEGVKRCEYCRRILIFG